jgi:hypothetical protein
VVAIVPATRAEAVIGAEAGQGMVAYEVIGGLGEQGPAAIRHRAQAGTAVDGGAIVVACREPSMSVKRKVTVPVGRSAIADLHPMLISA